MRTVDVARVGVADATIEQILADVGHAVLDRQERPHVYFALHVGGLNHASSSAYVRTMNAARLTYADGMSVVWLAKLAGAKNIVRAGTTDIGIPLIRTAQEALGRPLRIAVVGGPPGLADRAGATLVEATGCTICFTADGYQDDFGPMLDELREMRPDLLVVGLGMPKEAHWVMRNIADINATLVITCGGWLGFLAGLEKRAPSTFQRIGMEWVFRLAQNPRRLASRYVVGAFIWLRLVAVVSLTRLMSQAPRGSSHEPVALPTRIPDPGGAGGSGDIRFHTVVPGRPGGAARRRRVLPYGGPVPRQRSGREPVELRDR